MSVIVENENGYILDHLKSSLVTVKISNNSETDESSCYQYRLNSDLFDIFEPFRTDSQFAKLKSNTENNEVTKNRRKRKRCEPLNVGEQMALDFHNEVKGYIEKAYDSLLELGKKLDFFMTKSSFNLTDNNLSAREAALLDGSQYSFIDMCEQSDTARNQKCHVCHHTGTVPQAMNGVEACQIWNQNSHVNENTGTQNCTVNGIETQQDWNQKLLEHDEPHRSLQHCLQTVQVSEVEDLSSVGVVNVLWQNRDQSGTIAHFRGDNFIIPANSTFLLSDISQLNKSSKALGKFDLIVMDPPWTNKSVKRKKKYYTMDNEMLLDLPLCDLMNPGCIVVVWVTNKQKHLQFVTEQLFPSKNIKYTARWYWLKVTKTGHCVFDLDSPHKKPYETLLIGKYHPVTMETVNDHEKYSLDGEKNDLQKLNHKMTDHIGARDTCQADDLKLEISGNDRSSSNGNHGDKGHIYDNRVIMSVPCSLHSKKPPLTDVLKPYLSDDPKCLELFARNLLPGWTSWGNEVLLHQHENFYEKVT